MSVLLLLPIVLYVFKEESIHQNVLFHHQKLVPLKFHQTQSDLLKSLIVTVNVQLVKKNLINVLLVNLTELTIQHVIVLLDIMKKHVSVKHVHGNVLVVLLLPPPSVNNVTIQIIE
jgi:hypothetical protein